MTQHSSTTRDLAWLLDDMVDRVAHVQRGIVLSADGLLMAASRGFDREDAEHIAAAAAGFQSLARGVGRQIDAGTVRQTIVELDQAYLFVIAAGKGACLAVQAETEADVGLVAYEMAMLVTRVGQFLTSPARTVAAAAAEQ
ncbi:roadblock/LC7 domain-containing protein [Catellatospora chokoriensis]|uniref:Dynein regulation protein LC7 n=1 Tax=Catellatospora chokoriensis TaxID=310353 RepID=A0A8J3NV33_9ACTN|nr:roadblock/LC7 domain-containing protein [Catellatospora chokoriensis]GIF93625.1 dynein regulation protein LC7 [Catellatospora chokoriensis]